MHSHSNDLSIAGGWLGTYYYTDIDQEPERFEATFSLSGITGRFDGRILDDRTNGEAFVIDGIQAGRTIAFTKVYMQETPGYIHAPIYYEGVLSEEGRTLHGTWTLDFVEEGQTIRLHGVWNARRLWQEQNEQARDAEPSAERRQLATIGER